jgi:NAD(P)H-hydrate epimerase
MTRLTRNQVREIDRRAINDFHIPGIVLMENAARAVVDVALTFNAKDILIICGGGNNGGDGLAVARHLHNRGANVTIALTIDPSKYQGDALINWNITQAMKLPTRPFDIRLLDTPRPQLIIDAIFGTGLDKPPRDPFGEIAAAINASKLPVLAVDVPSGLDCDTGVPLGACIVATHTVTFVAEKVGFANAEAKKYLGRVTISDIGCPHELVDQSFTPIDSH